MEEKNETQTIAEDIINLVIARLETIPSNIELSVGNKGSFSIEELIDGLERVNESIHSVRGRLYKTYAQLSL